MKYVTKNSVSLRISSLILEKSESLKKLASLDVSSSKKENMYGMICKIIKKRKGNEGLDGNIVIDIRKEIIGEKKHINKKYFRFPLTLLG